MKELTTSEARTKLSRLIAEVKATHHPLKITSKQGNAVLIFEDDWRALVEAVYLMSIPGLAKEIKSGMNTPVKKCSNTPVW